MAPQITASFQQLARRMEEVTKPTDPDGLILEAWAQVSQDTERTFSTDLQILSIVSGAVALRSSTSSWRGLL